jgi:hypothetical protein
VRWGSHRHRRRGSLEGWSVGRRRIGKRDGLGKVGRRGSAEMTPFEGGGETVRPTVGEWDDNDLGTNDRS